MLVHENKFCLGRLLRSNYSIISGPTGQDARGGDLMQGTVKSQPECTNGFQNKALLKAVAEYAFLTK